MKYTDWTSGEPVEKEWSGNESIEWCVRCGMYRVSERSVLCTECLLDPKTQAEVDDARRLSDPIARAYVVERYSWVGWGRAQQ